MNVKRELALLDAMTIGQLQTRYASVFGEQPRSRHKQYLIRKIAWRMQANHEGGLSDRAIARAAELADPRDARVTAPRERIESASVQTALAEPSQHRDRRLPPVGAVVSRVYKGKTITVTALPDGFEYEGETYSSLSSVAKTVTGSHMNGFRFFGLEAAK